MSALLKVQSDIRATEAHLAELERAVAENPQSFSLQTMYGSVRQRLTELKEAFEQVSAALGIDVCHYRLFSDADNPTISVVASALSDFQLLFSTVYSSLKKGKPMARGRLGSATRKESALHFSYSYPGSLGIALTLENEDWQLFGTRLDEAMEKVLQLARAKTEKQILSEVAILGTAPIRELYKWANELANSGFGAEIEWRSGGKRKSNLLVEKKHLARLAGTITRASAPEERRIVRKGTLVGLDVEAMTFHLKIPGGKDLRGKADKSIFYPGRIFKLPSFCEATLIERTRISLMKEEEAKSFRLLDLSFLNKPDI